MENDKDRVRRWPNPVFRFIFGRSMITVLLLLLQIGYLVAGFLLLGKYMNIVIETLTILSAFLIIYIVSNQENPAYKMSWMILIMSVPILGVLLYLFVKINIGHRWIEKTMKTNISKTAPYMKQNDEVFRSLLEENVYAGMLAEYLFQNGNYPVYFAKDARFFTDGKTMKTALLEDLKSATDFIFIEYFIVDDGIFWQDVLKILKEKVEQGVEVRFMYDGMCSLVLLPFNYPKTLKKYGIKARMYAPIRPLLSTHQNNRDHRKIVVIDGECAYTGGINLADEYTNDKTLFGYWKDTAIRVNGDCVRSFTSLFLQMWNAEVNPGMEDFGIYINKTILSNQKTGEKPAYMIPYGDGPYQKENMAENVYMHILNTATKYVHIMTPYLILDHEIVTALLYAAKRGVDVKLILPHIPDKKIPFAIARTYYPELIEGGVKVYEFTPGFVHAKIFVCDDITAVVGSINLDYRSLYLHFEDAVYLYGHEVVYDIENDFENTIDKSKIISIDDYKRFPVLQRLMGKIFRVLGPLM